MPDGGGGKFYTLPSGKVMELSVDDEHVNGVSNGGMGAPCAQESDWTSNAVSNCLDTPSQ